MTERKRLIPAIVKLLLLVVTLTVAGPLCYQGQAGCLGVGAMIRQPLNDCAAATALLGHPIRISVGYACGNCRVGNPGGGYVNAGYAWASLPVHGPGGWGRYEYAVEKHHGTWSLARAQLTAGGRTIDLLPCAAPTGEVHDRVEAQQGTAAQLAADCDRGNPPSCLALGAMLAEGRGVPRDVNAARRRYDRACRLGLATACGLRDALRD
jgi:hypothetical protein